MRKPLFTGTCTALVTPFLDGQVNYPMLEMLIKRQIDSGIHHFVICGTTGEASTLSDEEKLEMFRRAKSYVGNDALIIAGTGSNSTKHAVQLSKEAEEAGADALLVVSPYYNKATPEGLIAHYVSVAHSVKIPLIVYNVPGRTGVDIPVNVYQSLSRIPNIAGVKEASTSISKILQIRSLCADSFPVWAGNDDMTVPTMALGGSGVISVASNICPVQMQAMTCAALDGDFDTASGLQCHLSSLMEALFSEVNPIPVKAAMKLIGYDCGECRLPLTPLTAPNKEKLRNILLQA